TRAYLAGLPLVARGLAQVRPAVVVLAHTASSYANGFANEPALVERLSSLTGAPGVTAAGAVRAALQHLGAKRLALGTPYQERLRVAGRPLPIAGFGRLLRDVARCRTTSASSARRSSAWLLAVPQPGQLRRVPRGGRPRHVQRARGAAESVRRPRALRLSRRLGLRRGRLSEAPRPALTAAPREAQRAPRPS